MIQNLKSPNMEFCEQSKPKLMASVSTQNMDGCITNYQHQQQGFAANNNNTTPPRLPPPPLESWCGGCGGPLESWCRSCRGGNDNNNNNNGGYLKSFPPGYRFCPFDYELVDEYLKKKVRNLPLPCNMIRDVNLYDHNPDDLTEQYQVLGEKEWYFFTPRERKYKNGDRPNRAAGNGYWKATGADKSIKNEEGEIVGQKKALVFYEGKPPKGDKTNWIMHEYGVKDPPRSKRCPDDMRLDEWVLCRIYKKNNNNKYIKARRRGQEFHSSSNEDSSPPVNRVEKNCSFNQIGEGSNGGVLNQCGGDYSYQMERPKIPLPHFDASLQRQNIGMFNGHLHPGLNYGGIQPISSFRPLVDNNSNAYAYSWGPKSVTANNAFTWGSKPMTGIANDNAAAFAPYYTKEDAWGGGSKPSRGIQDDVWGIQNQADNCDLVAQFNFTNNIMDDSYNMDSIFPNHVPKSPSMPPPNDE